MQNERKVIERTFVGPWGTVMKQVRKIRGLVKKHKLAESWVTIEEGHEYLSPNSRKPMKGYKLTWSYRPD
jgi:hypothetical protein